ncbi:hypothetical protein FACS1894168_3220 [Deltaproteobacteria bacterium]|nr:hypothetical protein FACS1894168_3220 [Deltaproteobacteria bacterium]
MGSYYMQHMLLQYGKQLTTARRLARYRQAILLAEGRQLEASSEETRKLLVSRVTREIVENLLLAGSSNAMVLEVKKRLNKALGEEVVFLYPPGELDMLVLRVDADGKEIAVDGEEKGRVMGMLWSIAEAAVDETML